MLLETFSLPNLVNSEDLTRKTVIVLDILRATTNIVSALANGCKEIIPTITVEEALDSAKKFSPSTVLLGGERKRLRIEGFDLGNSPWEYSQDFVQDKTIVFTTTNGTKAIRKANSASWVLIGSFLNASAVADHSLSLGKDIVILCSGTVSRFSLEDSVAAGYIINYLAQKEKGLDLDDLSIALKELYLSYANRLSEALSISQNGKALVELGKSEDIQAAVQLNTCSVVPFFQDDKIKLISR